MTTATGDIALDVSGVANTNPYTLPTELTGYGDPKRVFNGKIRIWDAGGFYTTDAPTSDTVTAVIEIGSDNGDNFGPAVVNTSLNGWYLVCRYDVVNLMPISAGVGSTNLGADRIFTTSQAMATGDLVTLEYTNSTGAFRVLHNGTEIGTVTDSTYDDLRSGYHCVTSDYSDTGAFSWAATGYAAASGPTLSSVPATAYPGQSRTITGSGFGASKGTGGVTLGGVAQTVTAWSDTSITFTTVQGGLKFQTGLTLEVTTDGSQTASDTMDLVVEAGTGGYIDVVDPATTDESSLAYQFETAGGDPVATGDQCEWRYTGVSGDPTSVTVGADTLITSLDQEGDLETRFWDATDSTWGDWATVTAEVPVVDETAPTFTSVDVPTAGSYKAGDALEFTANASETITVTGTPQLPINIGGTTRQADYVSGTQELLFRYTVQAGDNDANGIGVGLAIGLNGGSIADAATNNANLTLNSIGDTSGVLVDTVKPVITPVGGSTTTIVVGSTYTDQGATAFDDQDGSLGTVTGTGSVDTETIGEYTITYPGAGVVDSAGNVANDATRTVSVVAGSPAPAISLRQKMRVSLKQSLRKGLRGN